MVGISLNVLVILSCSEAFPWNVSRGLVGRIVDLMVSISTGLCGTCLPTYLVLCGASKPRFNRRTQTRERLTKAILLATGLQPCPNFISGKI